MFERLAALAVRRGVARLLADLPDVLPDDVRVEATEDGVVLSGQYLSQRLVRDARLRGLGQYLRRML